MQVLPLCDEAGFTRLPTDFYTPCAFAISPDPKARPFDQANPAAADATTVEPATVPTSDIPPAIGGLFDE